MTKGRLEAFTDGVLAILLTIMVLELHVPEGTDTAGLLHLVPALLTYLLSFVFLGIYWNNHHHMLHLVQQIDGRVLWANLHLLFWLSLVPITTEWMGEHERDPVPTAAYGVVLLCSGVAWLILQTALIRRQGEGSRLAAAVGADAKGKLSAVLYTAAVGLAFVEPALAQLLYVGVAAMWLVPDRRFEAHLVG